MNESSYFNFLGKVKGIESIISMAGNLSFKNSVCTINWHFYKIRGLDTVYKLLLKKTSSDVAMLILKYYLDDGVHFTGINGRLGHTRWIKTETTYLKDTNSCHSIIYKHNFNLRNVECGVNAIPFQNQLLGEILMLKITEQCEHLLNAKEDIKIASLLNISSNLIDFIEPIHIESTINGWRLLFKNRYNF
jgi:hypothetical protein